METTKIISNDSYVWMDNTYTESGNYKDIHGNTLDLTIIKNPKYKTFDLNKNSTKNNLISIFNQMIAILDNADKNNIIIKIMDINNQSNYESLCINKDKNINDSVNIQNILFIKDRIFIWSKYYIYIYVYEIHKKNCLFLNENEYTISFYKQFYIQKEIVYIYNNHNNIYIYSKDKDKYYLQYFNNMVLETKIEINLSNFKLYNVSDTNIYYIKDNKLYRYDIINKNSYYILELNIKDNILDIFDNILYFYEKQNLYKINLNTQKKTLVYSLPEFSNFNSLKLYINKPDLTENHIDIYLHNTNTNTLYIFNNDTYCIINAPNKIQKTYDGNTQILTLNNYLFLTNIAVGDEVTLDDNIWNYDTSNIGNDIHITSTKKIKLVGKDADHYNLIYHFIDKIPVSNPSNNSESKVYLSGNIIA